MKTARLLTCGDRLARQVFYVHNWKIENNPLLCTLCNYRLDIYTSVYPSLIEVAPLRFCQL